MLADAHRRTKISLKSASYRILPLDSRLHNTCQRLCPLLDACTHLSLDGRTASLALKTHCQRASTHMKKGPRSGWGFRASQITEDEMLSKPTASWP